MYKIGQKAVFHSHEDELHETFATREWSKLDGIKKGNVFTVKKVHESGIALKVKPKNYYEDYWIDVRCFRHHRGWLTELICKLFN